MLPRAVFPRAVFPRAVFPRVLLRESVPSQVHLSVGRVLPAGPVAASRIPEAAQATPRILVRVRQCLRAVAVKHAHLVGRLRFRLPDCSGAPPQPHRQAATLRLSAHDWQWTYAWHGPFITSRPLEVVCRAVDADACARGGLASLTGIRRHKGESGR